MDEYIYGEDAYDPDEGKVTGGKVLKKIVKYTFWATIIFVNAIILWRIFSSGDPAFAKDYLWNTEAEKAYNNSPETFELHYVERDGNMVYRLMQDKFNGRKSESAFKTSHVYYEPSTGQIQFTVRYNRSMLKEVALDYGLEETPKGEPFVFVLYDSNGNYYYDYKYASERKNLYYYKKVIFSGIDTEFMSYIEEKMNEPVDTSIETDENGEVIRRETPEYALTLAIFYESDVDLSHPYAVMTVYSNKYRYTSITPEKPHDVNEGLRDKIQYIVKGD